MQRILLLLALSLLSFPAWSADIISARFSLATERYDHCVLGDCTEYGALEAVLDDGRILAFRLEDGSVFEDVEPRLVPMGLNGRMAVLTVRSYQDTGAALVLLDQRGDKLHIAAESDAIGLAHRWQNPVGAGDFDRDGILEIASVITPHIGGRLTLFERQGKKLVPGQSASGFSNHERGSDELDLHEIIDWNNDKTPDIVLPDSTRKSLQVITFVNKKPEIITEKTYNTEIIGPITKTVDDTAIRVGLRNALEDVWRR